MFADDEPLLARVRRIALSLPGAAEKVSHGRPAFFTTRVFAYYGGSLKIGDEWVEHGRSVVVLLDPGERQALLGDARVFVPGYLGASGWVGLDLDDTPDSWDEVAELVEASYRSTAPKRRVAELDERG
jgi:YjbR